MILRRWSWLIVLPLAVAAGIAVFQVVYLERDLRHEVDDELSAPLDASRVEVEYWNRLREMARSSGAADSYTITDSTFSSLNAAHRIDDSRTTLLARRGDSIIVLASGSRDSLRLPNRAFAYNSAVKQLKTAFTSRRGGGGTGHGLVYERAAYSVAPVRGTDWVLLREVDGPSLIEELLLPFAINVAFIASLIVFAFAYLRSRVRETNLRREQELSEVRADFLAAVSHELRTPLAQIRMFAELLRNGAMRKPDEMSRALNVIEKESSRLSILVDNVLNYARLRRESAPPSVDEKPVTDVNRDIDYVMDAFAPLANEKQVILSSTAETVSQANVDSEAVRQILLNFLENAVKYGPRGQTVTIGARREGERVRIWIEDQGPGVEQNERESIWTAFRRGKAGTESRTTGAGIGLSVVHDLVKKYGGRVWVEDNPNGGARFIAEFGSVQAQENNRGTSLID